MKRTLPYLLVFAACAALPALSLGFGEGGYLAAPQTELPVRLWTYETFGFPRFLGGLVGEIGYPQPGMLNNPDPLGTLLYGLLVGPLGSAAAFDLPVLLHLWANMVAAWLLAREVTRDDLASATAAISFGLAPLVLTYPVMCAVTDIAILWPYPLALLALLRAPERPGPWGGLAAGGWLGVGFVTCPYNTAAFGALVLPVLLWTLVRVVVTRIRGDRWVLVLRPWAHTLVLAAVGFALAGGWYVIWMRVIMGDPEGLVSDGMVASTRPSWPFAELRPGVPRRYTAFLVDWFAIGKGSLVVTDFVSRFFRAFSPGYTVWAAAVAALALGHGRRRVAAFLALVVVVLVIASTGPFLPVTRSTSLPFPGNVLWLALHYAVPGGRILQEPLRYAFPALLALAVLAALGVRVAADRWGRWVAVAAPALLLAELVLLSPVPVPLPTWTPEVSPAMARLGEVLPPGPVVELPLFERGSQRLRRIHFLDQTVHGRPIPDVVVGVPPRYVMSNRFLAALVQPEEVAGEMRVWRSDSSRVAQDMAQLSADGFVGLVLNRSGYRSPAHADRAVHLASQAGPATRIGDVTVVRLLPSPPVAAPSSP